MTEERETKTENIFIELQEEDTKPVLKDEEPLPPKLTEQMRTKIKERKGKRENKKNPK